MWGEFPFSQLLPLHHSAHGKALLYDKDTTGKVHKSAFKTWGKKRTRKGNQHNPRNTLLLDKKPAPLFSMKGQHRVRGARHKSSLTAPKKPPLLELGVGEQRKGGKKKRSALWCAWNHLHLQTEHQQNFCCFPVWFLLEFYMGILAANHLLFQNFHSLTIPSVTPSSFSMALLSNFCIKDTQERTADWTSLVPPVCQS